MSSNNSRDQKMRQFAQDFRLVHTCQDDEDLQSIRVENCIGFCKIPIGIAGPLHITGPGVDQMIHAPLATCEATLIASCSRGCKAFNSSGGIRFQVFGDGMSRAPVFIFKDPSHAITFYKAVPTFRDQFTEWANSTSRFARLQEIQASVIGSNVHLLCIYSCGDAVGQNMVTKATAYACQMMLKNYTEKFHFKDL
ncbi:hypothetical protein IL306_006617 [Fusarium sp. DS 682]|nr:hypothetical protein IL306_006617 [Fusarium sp. DS 682]